MFVAFWTHVFRQPSAEDAIPLESPALILLRGDAEGNNDSRDIGKILRETTDTHMKVIDSVPTFNYYRVPPLGY